MATFEVLTSSNVIGGGGGGGSSYLVYVARLDQIGSGQPTTTEFQDTITVGSWSRVSTGYYTASITGTTNCQKVFASGMMMRTVDNNEFFTDNIPLYSYADPSIILGVYRIVVYDNGNGTGAIELRTFDGASGVSVDFSDFGNGGEGSICLPEIRVYP